MTNMITRFLLIFAFLCSSTVVVGQKQRVADLLYEVTIQSGAGTYGQTSIKFQLEGMLLRTMVKDEKNNTIERKVDFIPIKQIDSRKMLNLFAYIYSNNLMKLDYECTPNPYYPVDMQIRILDMNGDNYVQYCYNKYHPLFDELIVLMNNLVPKKYRKIYQTKGIAE